MRIKDFKRKHKFKNSKDIFLLQHQIIKLLNTNNRTIDLLVKERLIKNAFGPINSVYTLSDIAIFVRAYF